MRASIHCLGIAVLVVSLSSAAMSAWGGPKTQLPENPNDLVREAVQHELKAGTAQDDTYLSWKQRTVKPNRTIVRKMVETPDGILARVISINDRPLTPDELKKEEARLNRLLDPSQMSQKRKEQKEDENRTRKVVSALPDAFLYQYDGTEEKNGHTLVNLKFTPNPNFSPPSREALVLQGMQGVVIVDATAKRIVKIDGTMMRDVSIGWGIIGRLNKGGRFVVDQAPVEDNRWAITHMVLNFTGKALIFKSIRIDSVDTASDFKKVPKLSVSQALEMLKKSDTPQPQNGGGAVADKQQVF